MNEPAFSVKSDHTVAHMVDHCLNLVFLRRDLPDVAMKPLGKIIKGGAQAADLISCRNLDLLRKIPLRHQAGLPGYPLNWSCYGSRQDHPQQNADAQSKRGSAEQDQLDLVQHIVHFAE